MLTSLTLSLLTCLPLQEDAPSRNEDPADGLLVRALANEGFLLEYGDTRIVIDAFVTEPYSIYAALEEELREQLVTASGPFANVDLALVSHVHRDHFQARAAQRFLAASPRTRLWSSNAVIDGLWETESEATERLNLDAIEAVYPDVGEESRRTHERATITFFPLSHVDQGRDAFGNLGHVIELGGVRALHVGDAAMNEEVYAAYGLGERGIDVVFVPYWYFLDANGRRIVERHFRPAKLIACHVPPRELQKVTAQLARRFPDVVVFQEQLEARRFRDLSADQADDSEEPGEVEPSDSSGAARGASRLGRINRNRPRNT